MLNIFKIIKSWFKKPIREPFIRSEESEKSFQEWYDWGISCYLGEDKPMPSGRRIWFISYNDDELLKKYGPPKYKWSMKLSVPTGADVNKAEEQLGQLIANYSDNIEWDDSKELQINKGKTMSFQKNYYF